MQLRYNIEMGWPSQLKQIKRKIGAYKRHGSAFKIGITNNPKRRMHEYEKNCSRHYSEMIVIYMSSSRVNAGKLETLLVEGYWDDPKIRNQIAGNGGRWGEGMQYLYVVRRRRNR